MASFMSRLAFISLEDDGRKCWGGGWDPTRPPGRSSAAEALTISKGAINPADQRLYERAERQASASRLLPNTFNTASRQRRPGRQ